jgi:hypothetical protein
LRKVAIMATDKDKVEVYFKHVVEQYNCGDIRQLLDLRLREIGPLLACTVNGIDTVGGMMLGFREGSKKRSVEFLRQHLRLSKEEAELTYCLVRCGLSHEGIAKLRVGILVHYQRILPGTVLYKSPDDLIWLNVTELAWLYLDAVDTIGKDLHSHLHHTPEPTKGEILVFQNAMSVVKTEIPDFGDDEALAGSLGPFVSELSFFKVRG